ncbi:hypothetical protein LTR27_000405 [Elasticomyces elasticus]|nr:hypothetical protein LTR27_000405 [Elasticomyces elasticus]
MAIVDPSPYVERDCDVMVEMTVDNAMTAQQQTSHVHRFPAQTTPHNNIKMANGVHYVCTVQKNGVHYVCTVQKNGVHYVCNVQKNGVHYVCSVQKCGVHYVCTVQNSI